MSQFFGKYRGTVIDIDDPLMTFRIRANVPDVMGELETGWALPCAPFAGASMGFFSLPKVGALVWIEFEHGDPDYPIWTGGFWGSAADIPPAILAPPYQKTVIQTSGGQIVTLDDTPGIGGISLESSAGQKITMNATGITIDNGMGATITLQGPQVSINNGALGVI